jgi:hypothetical protein
MGSSAQDWYDSDRAERKSSTRPPYPIMGSSLNQIISKLSPAPAALASLENDPLVLKTAEIIVSEAEGKTNLGVKTNQGINIDLFDGPRIVLNAQQCAYLTNVFSTTSIRVKFTYCDTQMYNQSGYSVLITSA